VRGGERNRLVDEMDVGDVVLIPDTPRRELVIGRLAGPYRFHAELPADRYRHRRAVDWIEHIAFEQLPPAAQNLHRQQQTLTEKRDPQLFQLLR
jgi:predicted Mrr-cat superfamily restriction endonuclease